VSGGLADLSVLQIVGLGVFSFIISLIGQL